MTKLNFNPPANSTLTNTSLSYKQKIEIINSICFMTQKMNKKDPSNYKNCIDVLNSIFNVNLLDSNSYKQNYTIDYELIKSFGILCDDLLWGNHDELENPTEFKNLKDIKNKIINYFTEEWMPF